MTDKLEKTGATALVTVPDDLIQDAGRGTEAITSQDVQPPRLRICQAGTPQRKPDNPKKINGLNELDLFNDQSEEIYGRGPLKMIVIASLGHHWVHFDPDNLGTVLDRDVPDDDPRAQWTKDEDGKSVKPIATKFYDYLVFLPDKQDVCVLSFKSTEIKTAIQLNGKLKSMLKIEGQVIANPPAWARTFELTTGSVSNDQGEWGIMNIKNAGITPTDVRLFCRQLADQYAKRTIVIDRDEADFEPRTERQPGDESGIDM